MQKPLKDVSVWILSHKLYLYFYLFLRLLYLCTNRNVGQWIRAIISSKNNTKNNLFSTRVLFYYYGASSWMSIIESRSMNFNKQIILAYIWNGKSLQTDGLLTLINTGLSLSIVISMILLRLYQSYISRYKIVII